MKHVHTHAHLICAQEVPHILLHFNKWLWSDTVVYSLDDKQIHCSIHRASAHGAIFALKLFDNRILLSCSDDFLALVVQILFKNYAIFIFLC